MAHPDFSYKVLVVEDDLEMRIFLSNLLSANRIPVLIAKTNIEGLEMARQEKPALIILESMVTVETGFQMYLSLKNDDELRNVPVVMLSALDKKTFYYCYKHQCTKIRPVVPKPDAVLTKPVQADEFLSVVRQLVRVRNRGDPAHDV